MLFWDSLSEGSSDLFFEGGSKHFRFHKVLENLYLQSCSRHLCHNLCIGFTTDETKAGHNKRRCASDQWAETERNQSTHLLTDRLFDSRQWLNKLIAIKTNIIDYNVND